METTRSPRKVVWLAFAMGRKAFRDHRSKYSRRDFTRPQLFAVLVLKEFERKSYRGVEALLLDWPELCGMIGLKKVPDHTTLCQAAADLLKLPGANRVLDHTIKLVRTCKLLGKFVRLGAMDGTGYESHHASAYYVKRRARGRQNKDEMTYRHFPKLGIAVDASRRTWCCRSSRASGRSRTSCTSRRSCSTPGGAAT
jgi:hypothetical protein